jgi:hypothetical protein
MTETKERKAKGYKVKPKDYRINLNEIRKAREQFAKYPFNRYSEMQEETLFEKLKDLLTRADSSQSSTNSFLKHWPEVIKTPDKNTIEKIATKDVIDDIAPIYKITFPADMSEASLEFLTIMRSARHFALEEKNNPYAPYSACAVTGGTNKSESKEHELYISNSFAKKINAYNNNNKRTASEAFPETYQSKIKLRRISAQNDALSFQIVS